MADDDSIKSDIIHGRTPNRGWYPKGKSGNPRGRPKKRKDTSATADTSVRDDFLKAADSLMKMVENGREVTITQRQAVERSQYIAAVKGGPHAQRNYFARDDKFRSERAEDIAENHQWWIQYVRTYDLVAKDYADRREPLPDYYPHPEELHFPKGKFVTGWMGGEPMNASVIRANFTRLRDVWLLQAEWDRRHSGAEHEIHHLSGTVALFINAILPEASQLNEPTLLVRLGRQHMLRKRELQRRLASSWATVGCPGAKPMMTPILDDAARARAFARLCERFGVEAPITTNPGISSASRPHEIEPAVRRTKPHRYRAVLSDE